MVDAAITTAVLFGGMSIIGMLTGFNLGRFSSFFMMALLGLIIAIVVNIFLQSSTLNLAISIFGVLLFTGLTAYDTQRIFQMARDWSGNGDHMMRAAVLGALTLYLDLVNMFIYVARLMATLNQR